MKLELHYVNSITLYSPEKIPIKDGHYFQHKIVIKGQDIVTILLNSGSDMITQIITPTKKEKTKKEKKWMELITQYVNTLDINIWAIWIIPPVNANIVLVHIT